MRKASIKQNHEDFESSLDVIEKAALHVLARPGQLGIEESGALLNGLALALAGRWEEVVDEDFVDALNRDTSQYAEYLDLDLPKNLSRDMCFGLLVGDGYLDFRNTGQIVGRAKRVLVAANNPFVSMTKTVRRSIDQFYVLRNYLAHRSARARRAYDAMLKADFDYKYFSKPGTFLRAKGNSLGKPRILFFIHRFREASQAIRAKAPF